MHRATSPLYQDEPLIRSVVRQTPLGNGQVRQQSTRSAYDVYSVPNAVALNEPSATGRLSAAVEVSGSTASLPACASSIRKFRIPLAYS
ncbi:unnamed protein product [Dibothriocephalus latus]|uniref:Uncharacterized protein n=1 Tax=Dibothriocephalus latus TaxID=60516 RepID=A0A3P7RG50_DIBLA|nr:unnamed protein product [Dibothriocephalus latus]